MTAKAIGFALVMTLVLQQAFAQSDLSETIFTLNGRLTGAHVDTVLLYYKNLAGQNTFQSRPVFNDRFIITDSLKKPTDAIILFKELGEVLTDSAFEARSKEIYLEPGRLYLKGDPAHLDSIKLTGSQSELEWEELNRNIAPIKAEMKPLTDRYNNEKDPEKAEEIGTLFAPYEDRIKSIAYQFFLDHPNSFVTANEMTSYVTQESLDSSKRIYNNFSFEQKQSEDGRKVAEEIGKMEAALPGNLAADFTAADTAGKAVALSDYKGKYVLLDFWASWNPQCRQTDAHLVELYNKYKGKGLTIISIAWDDDTRDAWKKAIVKDGIGLWPQLLCGTGTADDIGDKYAIHYVPTKILIGQDGKIIGRWGDNNPHADVIMDRVLVNLFKE